MQEEIFIRECGVTISQVVTASYYENIKGEMTLSFQVPTEQVQRVEVGQRLEFGRQYFDIVSMEQSIAEGRFLTTISAEQISLSLADEEYDLESFVFSGTAKDALDAILDDTDFYGYISSNSGMHVEFNHTGTINRRALLQELCGKIQCELQYDREMIELVSPEDSRGMINVEDYPMIEFNISRTKEGTTYELVTNRFDELAVGATAYIELREPYNIFERSRVIALSYNPFYRKEIVVTMGDYQPDIIDEMVDDREETENIRDSLKDYVQKTSLSTEIESYIDNNSAKIVSAVSGTYQTKDGMSEYVTKTNLNTSIGQYIDNNSAKIVSAVSGTYQTKDGMSAYAKTTVTSKIEQDVSDIESEISLTTSYGSGTIGSNVRALLQLVTNADKSTIRIKADKIELTGDVSFVSNSRNSEGEMQINGNSLSIVLDGSYDYANTTIDSDNGIYFRYVKSDGTTYKMCKIYTSVAGSSNDTESRYAMHITTYGFSNSEGEAANTALKLGAAGRISIEGAGVYINAYKASAGFITLDALLNTRIFAPYTYSNLETIANAGYTNAAARTGYVFCSDGIYFNGKKVLSV